MLRSSEKLRAVDQHGVPSDGNNQIAQQTGRAGGTMCVLESNTRLGNCQAANRTVPTLTHVLFL